MLDSAIGFSHLRRHIPEELGLVPFDLDPLTYTEEAAGGLLLAGAGTEYERLFETGAGGLALAGDVAEHERMFETGDGGLLLAGNVAEGEVMLETGDGGLELGGAVDESFSVRTRLPRTTRALGTLIRTTRILMVVAALCAGGA